MIPTIRGAKNIFLYWNLGNGENFLWSHVLLCKCLCWPWCAEKGQWISKPNWRIKILFQKLSSFTWVNNSWKILKALGDIDFARPSILPTIMIRKKREILTLFAEIIKQSFPPCMRQLLLKNFLVKMKFSGNLVVRFRYFLQLWLQSIFGCFWANGEIAVVVKSQFQKDIMHRKLCENLKIWFRTSVRWWNLNL